MPIETKKGFTLVELLVVMAIIGILATVIMGGFRSSQRRSRDAARKSDLKQISNALEMFYSDHERYPADNGSGSIKACSFALDANGLDISTACEWGLGPMTDNNTDYMRTLPEDPSDGDYYYRTIIDANQGFQLYAHLENSEDQNCIGGDCLTNQLEDVDCGEICNYAVTSANVSPTD